jgi:predicted regulator of Ras-like GTPase activity (Roadblock/LC7/MglB family)
MSSADARLIFNEVVETRGVEGVFEISGDGFIVRSLQCPSTDPEAVAAVIASTMRSWNRIGQDLKLGTLRWVLLEYEHGRVIAAPLDTTLLVVVGSLHLVCAEILAKIRRSAPPPGGAPVAS